MNTLEMPVSGKDTTGAFDVPVTDDEAGFRTVLATKRQKPASAAAKAGLAGPATLSREMIASGASAPTLPPDDDDTFLVVKEVSTAISDEGEEVAVISGEAVEGVDEAIATAAERDDAIVVPLSEARFLAQNFDGSYFASMLINQRSGVLPNPYSLMRLSDRIEAADDILDTQGLPAEGAPVMSGGGTDTALGQGLGQEMSRVERAVSQVRTRLEQALAALRARVGIDGAPPP